MDENNETSEPTRVLGEPVETGGVYLDEPMIAALLDLGVEPSIPAAPTAGDAEPKGRRARWKSRWAFVVPAKAAATGGLIVAIAALAALALVANAEGADGLSTIALSLAILAFVVQILVFIAQAQASSQQMLQSEQLNTQTRVLLAEVQTSARSTELLVREQFHDLLKAFVDAAPGEGGKVDMEGFERRLMEGFESRLAAREVRGGQRVASAADVRRSTAERANQDRRARRLETVRLFRRFPEEGEGVKALVALKELTPEQRGRLVALAEDEIESVASGSYVGLELTADDEDLLRRGLMAKAQLSVESEMRLVGRLTDDGKAAARLLMGVGEVPSWAAAELPLPGSAATGNEDDAGTQT